MRNYVIKLSHLNWCSAVCEIPKVLVPVRNRRLEDHIQLTAFKGGLIPEFISNFVKFSKKEKKKSLSSTFHPKLRGLNAFIFFENGYKLKKKEKNLMWLIYLHCVGLPFNFQFENCHPLVTVQWCVFSYFSTDDFIRHQPFFLKVDKIEWPKF